MAAVTTPSTRKRRDAGPATGRAGQQDLDVRVFPLRYAQAQDLTYTVNGRDQIVPGVATLLRNTMRSTSPRARRELRQTQCAFRRAALARAARHRHGRHQLAADGRRDVRERAQRDPGRRHAFAAEHRGGCAHELVVIYNVPAMMPHYQRAIAMLDQPQALIEINTPAVIDLTSGLTSRLGVQWGGANGRVNLGVWARPPRIPASQARPARRRRVRSSLNFATLIGNSTQYLFSQIQALENGKAHIVSAPPRCSRQQFGGGAVLAFGVRARRRGNQDVGSVQRRRRLTSR